MWGCDGPAENPYAMVTCERCLGYDEDCEVCKGDPKGRYVYVCPFKAIPSYIMALSRIYADWKAGYLWFPGLEWREHPAWIVEAVYFLDGQINEIESEKMKAATENNA